MAAHENARNQNEYLLTMTSRPWPDTLIAGNWYRLNSHVWCDIQPFTCKKCQWRSPPPLEKKKKVAKKRKSWKIIRQKLTIFMQMMQYSAPHCMYVSKFSGVPPLDPLLALWPRTGPLPSKILTARLRNARICSFILTEFSVSVRDD